MLPPALLQQLATYRIAEARPVSGGDINEAALLKSHDGQQFFIKYNRSPQAAEMLRTEAQGLQILGGPGILAVPNVLEQGTTTDGAWAWLLLEFVPAGPRTRGFWERFGRQLAALHRQTAAYFGLHHDNFIGSLPQSNHPADTWAGFYAQQRLLPQMRIALQIGRMNAADAAVLESLCRRLPDICPQEPPALTHGDLWGGNFICNTASRPVLIDPAVSYAHREMDLAMSRLFGGFDAVFYDSYHEAWPTEPGYEAREDVYQLYYLLVHVNLFGGGYVDSVRRILKNFRNYSAAC